MGAEHILEDHMYPSTLCLVTISRLQRPWPQQNSVKKPKTCKKSWSQLKHKATYNTQVDEWSETDIQDLMDLVTDIAQSITTTYA